MNEKLKELRKQAAQFGQDDYNNRRRNRGPLYEENELNDIVNQKFAELIVQECARYINERTQDWDADLRWIFNDGSGFMDVDVTDLLNKHFGVEE
jgi:hypothetical protein